GGGMGTAHPRDTQPLVLDVRAALSPAGGIGRYTRDLATALDSRPDAPPARFAFPVRMRDGLDPRWRAERLQPLPGGERRWRWTLLASAAMPWLADAYYGRPHVVHSTAGWGPV